MNELHPRRPLSRDPEPGSAPSGLRPIVYGLPRVAPGAGPEYVASVHSPTGDHLGYVVVDRARAAACWGALLAMPRLTVDDACLLARGTTHQLALFSLPQGSSHFLLTGGGGGEPGQPEWSAFLEALRPLTDDERCRIVLDDGPRGPRPQVAREGLLASAVAATSAALELAGRGARGAVVALNESTPLAYEVAEALTREGLVVLDAETGGGLFADADVVLVGTPIWSVDAREAALVRAPVIVALGATRSSLMAEDVLHERGIALVPDAVAGAGRLLALHLHELGADEAEAIAETGRLAAERFSQVLACFPDRPIADGVRADSKADAEQAA